MGYIRKMWVYRLSKTKYLDTSFSGEGARIAGGRWNNKGNACVYSSLSEAQAILEVLVHLQNEAPLDAYSFTRIKLEEEDVAVLPEAHWPASWNVETGSLDARRLGDGWLKSNDSLALLVPSVFTRHEKNCLINPNHPDLKSRLESVETWPYSFDDRLV